MCCELRNVLFLMHVLLQLGYIVVDNRSMLDFSFFFGKIKQIINVNNIVSL